MNLTDLAIRKSITAFVLMLICVLAGVAAYIGLPREASPDVKIPFVMVYAPYFGTSPEDMESLVTRKLEKQLKSLSNLKEMSSTSSEGVSTVVLEFNPRIEMSDALQKTRDAVELAKPELPQDVKEDLIIYELSAEEWPIMQVVLSGDYDPVVLKEAAEDLQDELEQIKGILGVDLTGGIEREVRVDVNPERLRFYGLGLTDVIDAISFENVTLPGGDLALGTYEYQVRVPAEFASVDEISSILLDLATDAPVYLRDVANVSLGLKDPSTISRLNGVDAITLSVKKRSGENIIRISDEVRSMLERERANLPEGTHVTVTSDQSEYVRDMVKDLENNILSGLILVVAVLFLFLGLTNSVFVGIAIPFSMLISFIILSAFGVTLNMVVLFSLILALGMLVDNAIVIVENIFRHRTNGMGRLEAASFGTRQVAGAVIASTLTTVCAFGPLLFWPGIMGEFMKYLPLTVIITLSASLLVALIFNPVLCATFLNPPKNAVSVTAGSGKRAPRLRLGDRMFKMGLDTYEPTLAWALDHRFLTLGGAVLLFIVSIIVFGAFNAGVELFPDTDPTYAHVTIEAPSGTRIELSDSYAAIVEQEVAQVPDLLAYVTQVGAGSDDFGASQEAPPHLSLVNMEFAKMVERTGSSRDALTRLRERLSGFTGARLIIDKQEDGPPTGKPVNIEISGKTFYTLGELAATVREQIRSIPGLVDVQDDFDRGRPEIQIRPDIEKAARYGVRRQDIASTILTAIRGQEVTKYRVGEDEYDIVVRLDRGARQSVEDLEELTVFYEGEQIPLTAIADISYEAGLASIKRLDSRRVVTVTGDVATGFNANSVLAEVQSTLTDLPLPPGYRLDYTGESEDQEEASAFLSKAFVIAIMLIFVVLVTQFGSVTIPFVIMTSVILSMIGVFFGLLVTQTPFGIIMTGVGVISLAGVVVNNAIVLLDYILQLRRDGMGERDAIVEAGRLRFRPVVLTAVTTVLGLIPLTTGFSIDFGNLLSGQFSRAVVIGGESSQWWGPMGVAVIWGLVVATFLTLVIVPTLYADIEAKKRFFASMWTRVTGRSESKPASTAQSV